jgi:RING-variant domain
MINQAPSPFKSPPPMKLSIFSSPYRVIPEVSLPTVRLFVESKANTPLMLSIKSSESSSIQRYKFSAGERFKEAGLTPSFPKSFPVISNFDAEEIDEMPINDQKLKQCRVCLETENAQNMISPCLCKGFQKYIHQDCLKIWLLTSDKEEKELTYCEVCTGKYHMSFTYSNTYCICQKEFCCFWVCLGIVLGLCSVIVVLYCTQMANTSDTASFWIYSALAFAALFFFLASICKLKKTCEYRKVIDWTIENCENNISL